MIRVALVNEGTYPFVTGGVSTWCDQLVRGLPEIAWHLATIVGSGAVAPVVPLPDSVASLTTVPVWGPGRPPRKPPLAAAARLCRAMLAESPGSAAAFAAAVHELMVVAAGRVRPSGGGRHPLLGVPLADVLADTWAAVTRSGVRLPRLSLRDADEAAVLIEHALRPLAVSLPEVDVVHANANGLSSLMALAAKWRTGVPFLMTEHGVYLRERYPAAGDQPAGVKTAVLRFHRALARLAYANADLVAPVSGFNRRWEIRHGAAPHRVSVIPNGVDPQRFPPLAEEPAVPTISWVGRIDPLKDLETLIRALAEVRRRVPAARLHLAGPVPAGNETYAETCRQLVAELGLTDAVTFAGPVANSREAFAAGHIAALSSISEGMPYTVVEAMMCGRATVSTDVGGVAEMVGPAGVVVPPRDPDAFAAACVELLTDPARRRALVAAARARALDRFTLTRCLDAYRSSYAGLTRRAAAA